MKKIIKQNLLVISGFIMFSVACNTVPRELDETEKVSLYAYTKNDTLLIDETDNKKEVEEYLDLVSHSNAPEYKCGYNGKLVFETKEGTFDAEFNTAKDCSHLVIEIGDDLFWKRFTVEGLELLESKLKKKKL